MPRAAVLIAAVFAFAGCHVNISNEAEATTKWERSYPIAATGTLEILNTNGLIEVDPSEDGKVSVVADRIAKGSTEAAAKEAADAITIKEEVSGDKITLDAKVSLTSLLGGSRQVKFHVRAPKGITIRLSNTNGDIQVRSMTGPVHLSATNGRVKGTSLEGRVTAETTNGAVDLDIARVSPDGLSAETTNGAVVIQLPTDAKARIDARVSNGGIQAQGLQMTVTDESRRRLDATLNGGGPTIRLNTTNGGIRIRGR